MAYFCRECGSSVLESKDFVIRNMCDQSHEMLSKSSFIATECMACGWLTLLYPEDPEQEEILFPEGTSKNRPNARRLPCRMRGHLHPIFPQSSL